MLQLAFVEDSGDEEGYFWAVRKSIVAGCGGGGSEDQVPVQPGGEVHPN